MKARMYWTSATRQLSRGGQRTLLAVLCIAVGVLAIVSLQLVGNMVNTSLTGNIRDLNGGDLVFTDFRLTADQLAYFDHLRSQGTISSYTAVASTQGSAVGAHPGRNVPQAGTENGRTEGDVWPGR
jgi:putative ABC transport system permease protein